MHQPHIFEFGVADALAVETRKQRRRTCAVETFIVIEDSYPHKPFRLCGIPRPERASQNSASAKQKVGGNDFFGKGSEGEANTKPTTRDKRSAPLGRTTRQNGYSICTNWPVPTDDCGVCRVWGERQKSIYDT